LDPWTDAADYLAATIGTTVALLLPSRAAAGGDGSAPERVSVLHEECDYALH